jgi:hypothetical protein
MRSWLFHPLIFYPLAIVLAAAAILVSLRPQFWPRDPAPVAAQVVENALVYAGDAFSTPAPTANHALTVVRDFWGNAQSLRIGVQIEQGQPSPTEQGVRILIEPADAARINGRPATVEVSYTPLPINTSQGFAVSLQGAGPTTWAAQSIQPQTSTIRFELPAQNDVNAIGLRAINDGADRAFGLEITRIRIIPHA